MLFVSSSASLLLAAVEVFVVVVLVVLLAARRGRLELSRFMTSEMAFLCGPAALVVSEVDDLDASCCGVR